MPKEITHWILAERVLDELDENSRLSGIIRANHSAYLSGTVLPDTLLHLFRGPHSRVALQLANRFHDATGNSFAPLIQAEVRHAGGLPHNLFACLLGVISHMLTDSVFHPYVYALSGVNDIGVHYRLETAIDVYFLHCGNTPPVRRVDELITPETRQVLVDTAAMLFDPDGELPRTALEQALALHCRFQAMYDRTWWKIAATILGSLLGSPFREQRHLFYPLDASGTDHLKLIDSIREWRHPVSGAMSKTSLDELAEETVQQTVAVFRRIDERGSLAAALNDPPGANLLTGLFAVAMSEMEREMKGGSMI
jgi:hypothetical protein